MECGLHIWKYIILLDYQSYILLNLRLELSPLLITMPNGGECKIQSAYKEITS